MTIGIIRTALLRARPTPALPRPSPAAASVPRPGAPALPGIPPSCTVQPGDDKGGLRAVREPGDDKGGQRKDAEPGEDSGGHGSDD